ncbi:MAG: hypothetical protein E7211_18660 [Clostridium lundense]|nr:hypothetical protein [Clostridium lundense]
MKRFFEPDHDDAASDPLIRRMLAGETVDFEEWLDAECDSETGDDPVPTEDEMWEAAEARADFLRRLEAFGLPLDDRFRLCEGLYAKAVKEPSDALLCLYCELVCDGGYLLDVDRSERTAEQDALCFLRQRRHGETLYACLAGQRAQSERFRETLRQAGKARHPKSVSHDADDALAQRIANVYCEIMESKGGCEKLVDNIASLIQTARANDALRSIEPLFLYRALTRHAQRLQKDDAPQFDMEALWRYQHYQLEEDNGKNYRACVRYLSLFASLCSMFADEPDVDAELCLYGFDHLSNLGHFYRTLDGEGRMLDFDPELDDIFLKFPFSCFEHGYGDNVVLERSGLSMRELERYLAAKNHRRSCALDRVAKTMNRDLIELTTRFLETELDQVKELCEEILSSADLPLAQQPANKKERTLLLAAIDNALMEAQDDWAADYLIRAGKALIGDDPMTEL